MKLPRAGEVKTATQRDECRLNRSVRELETPLPSGEMQRDSSIYFPVSTPASLITFAHLSISSAMNARKCSGVSPISVAP